MSFNIVRLFWNFWVILTTSSQTQFHHVSNSPSFKPPICGSVVFMFRCTTLVTAFIVLENASTETRDANNELLYNVSTDICLKITPALGTATTST